MHIGFYNPYFDGLGGGERYTLTLASHWSKNHDVVLFWDDDSIRKISEQRFSIDLSRVKITQNIFKSKNVLKKSILSRQYDLIFFLSDGSVPTSLARRNILHFQIPFEHIAVHSLKLRNYQSIVCNSMFTKHHLDPKLGQKSIVIYPPVDISQFHSVKKENIVLSVGRFTSYFQAKKQEILIDAWKKMKLKNWRLVLAGGLLPSDQAYFDRLKSLSSGLSIELLPNVLFSDLVALYSKSSIYWHAAGFEEHDPKVAEHFGISTVEAMASRCIPVVFNGGGLPEIVQDGINGFLWNTEEELIEKTQYSQTEAIRKLAYDRAKDFDVPIFCNAFDQILKNLF